MSTIEVTTQAQLDKALEALKPGDWIVCMGGDYWNPLRVDGNASVEAYGNASVRAYGNASVRAYGNAFVEADGNASVRAYGNASVEADGNARVRAYGNARVRAYGNAFVEAYGNASVRADGNASVRADGNASVEAYGNASVEADGNASVRAYGNASVEARKYVAIHKFPTSSGKIAGGVIIEVPDLVDGAAWCDFHGVDVADGAAILFKALDEDFSTAHARERGIFYTLGAEVEAADWRPTPECGHGLHACARPWVALRYNRGAARYVQVRVQVADIVVIDDKVKVPALTVVCECDLDGDPVGVAA